MAHCNAVRAKSKAGAECTLPLSSIQRHVNLRSRVGPTNPDHVAGIKASILAGDPVPRPLVYHIAGRGHFLVGGWQRIEAYELAEVKAVPVLVVNGTWEQAVVAAAGQNREHDRGGLKRSNADKRHAVTMVLAAHPEWSDRTIEDATGTSDWLVADARKRLEVPDSGTSDMKKGFTNGVPFRLGQDGKMYPLPVPPRSRPSSREEHLEPLLQSWERNGASVLPLLKNGIPLPSVLAASQLNLKQLSAVVGRLLDLFDQPFIFRPLGRTLDAAERAELLEWIITGTFPELYGDDTLLGEQLEVLRDARFPAGALP